MKQQCKPKISLYCAEQMKDTIKEKENTLLSMKEKKDNRIKLLQQWTGCQIDNLLFDSNVDSWERKSSVLNNCIWGKKKLVFLFEIGNKGTIGYYFYGKTIEEKNESEEKEESYKKKNTMKVDSTTNFQCFFPHKQSRFSRELPDRYFIKKDINIGYTMKPLSSDYLIYVGDIIIMKNGIESSNKSETIERNCKENDNKEKKIELFDYRKNKKT